MEGSSCRGEKVRGNSKVGRDNPLLCLPSNLTVGCWALGGAAVKQSLHAVKPQPERLCLGHCSQQLASIMEQNICFCSIDCNLCFLALSRTTSLACPHNPLPPRTSPLSCSQVSCPELACSGKAYSSLVYFCIFYFVNILLKCSKQTEVCKS